MMPMQEVSQTVRPQNLSAETLGIAAAALIIIALGFARLADGGAGDSGPQLFDWQISAFHDLKPTDQAIYNALLTVSEELWWIHEDLLLFAEPDSTTAAWPTVEALDKEYAMAPFARGVASRQQGNVTWRRAAAYTFEGATVYHGTGGEQPGQSSYLLVLTHVHKGASYANGGRIWLHPDPEASLPATVKQNSLILNGWKEVIAYSGADEVQRLRSG